MYDVNIKFANEVLEVIPELKALTHLDISRDISVIEAERGQKFLDSVSQSQLMNLFGQLKELTYLDLSGNYKIFHYYLHFCYHGLNLPIFAMIISSGVTAKQGGIASPLFC